MSSRASLTSFRPLKSSSALMFMFAVLLASITLLGCLFGNSLVSEWESNFGLGDECIVALSEGGLMFGNAGIADDGRPVSYGVSDDGALSMRSDWLNGLFGLLSCDEWTRCVSSS